jgi:hypothetical protein
METFTGVLPHLHQATSLYAIIGAPFTRESLELETLADHGARRAAPLSKES